LIVRGTGDLVGAQIVQPRIERLDGDPFSEPLAKGAREVEDPERRTIPGADRRLEGLDEQDFGDVVGRG
jgi:hypothetical protein